MACACAYVHVHVHVFAPEGRVQMAGTAVSVVSSRRDHRARDRRRANNTASQSSEVESISPMTLRKAPRRRGLGFAHMRVRPRALPWGSLLRNRPPSVAKSSLASDVAAEAMRTAPRRGIIADLGVRSLLPEWKKMLRPDTLVQDISAGLTVGCVAVPLSLAIALASGVPPEIGLTTAAVAGVVGGLMGGTTLAITGRAI